MEKGCKFLLCGIKYVIMKEPYGEKYFYHLLPFSPSFTWADNSMVPAPCCKEEPTPFDLEGEEFHRITESPNGGGWKGPLWVI